MLGAFSQNQTYKRIVIEYSCAYLVQNRKEDLRLSCASQKSAIDPNVSSGLFNRNTVSLLHLTVVYNCAE